MRFSKESGELNFKLKQASNEGKKNFKPWFEWPQRAAYESTIVFGHWSTLGLNIMNKTVCTDSGCVWGAKLSAYDIENEKFISVPSLQK